MAQSLRDALFVDSKAESLDLSGRGLSDVGPLEGCGSLVSLSLAHNQHLASCAGLQHCLRLWTLDLRGCAMVTIEPILALGALSELHLAGNRLALPAALRLRSMAIGRLSLQGNPLLPGSLRESLGIKNDASDSRLLRSFLADMLPCVIALDDSFITSAERHECREYFGGTPSGRAMLSLLLSADGAGDGLGAHAQPMISCGALRTVGRAFERANALVTLVADWDLLLSADSAARAQADVRRSPLREPESEPDAGTVTLTQPPLSPSPPPSPSPSPSHPHARRRPRSPPDADAAAALAVGRLRCVARASASSARRQAATLRARHGRRQRRRAAPFLAHHRARPQPDGSCEPRVAEQQTPAGADGAPRALAAPAGAGRAGARGALRPALPRAPGRAH